MMRFLWILICLLSSCDRQTPFSSSLEKTTSWQTIGGRQINTSLYRAHTPAYWKRKDPISKDLTDTTQAICEFYIEEPEGIIRLTIHNFPTDRIEERIAPQLQIQRWKTQLEEADPSLTIVSPCSHGGFYGLFLETQGIQQSQPTKLLGWSMQLASCYYRALTGTNNPLDQERRADYTIKAVGPSHLIDKHRKSILAFANSFELIEELPYPL